MVLAVLLTSALALAAPALAQPQLTSPLPEGPKEAPKEGAPLAGGGESDPTQNVLNSLAAQAILDAQLRASDEALQVERVLRLDQMREAAAALARSERMAAKELAEVRFSTLEKLADLDREAVAEANRTATEDAKGLALTVQQTAEDLRGQNDTATAAALAALERAEERIVASLNGFDTRLTTLEQGASVNAGRGLVADPALASLQETVDRLASAQDTDTGRGSGQSDLWALILGGIATLIGIAAFLRSHAKNVN